MEDNSLEVGRCLYNCKGNIDCAAVCNDDFWIRQLECPCEVDFYPIIVLNKLNWLHRCRWRMFETKCVGDRLNAPTKLQHKKSHHHQVTNRTLSLTLLKSSVNCFLRKIASADVHVRNIHARKQLLLQIQPAQQQQPHLPHQYQMLFLYWIQENQVTNRWS